MRAEEILVHRRKLPFVPFRIHPSDGSSYDVHRQELVLVTRREVVIALSPGKGDVPERSVYCDPVHVTRMEQITPNGRGRRKSSRSSCGLARRPVMGVRGAGAGMIASRFDSPSDVP